MLGLDLLQRPLGDAIWSRAVLAPALPGRSIAAAASDLAESFLHHRILVVPIATAGWVHAVVTRSDFFSELLGKFEAATADGAAG